MILDSLNSAGKYSNLYPGIEEALEFLLNALNFGVSDGKHEINGKRIYASVSSEEGRGKEKSRLESHKKYIDIQFCLEGDDLIGWKPLDEVKEIEQEYNAEKDITFYSDDPKEYFKLSGNTFCILFPEDAHAPLSAKGSPRKIVIKIAV